VANRTWQPRLLLTAPNV